MAMPWLFYSFGGRVTPDPNPRSNDANMGYLCVATKSLILKFRRWRSENYAIEVAPSFEPTEFYDILDALRVVDPDADTTDRQLDFSWRAYAKLLEPRFRLLELAFEEERFPETQTRLARSFKNQA